MEQKQTTLIGLREDGNRYCEIVNSLSSKNMKNVHCNNPTKLVVLLDIEQEISLSSFK